MDKRLVLALDRVSQALEIRNLIRSVESGSIFRDHPRSFDPAERVDRYLLRNLSAARRALLQCKDRISPPAVHALLGRTIFACYLVDRQIIDGSYFTEVEGTGQNLREYLEASSRPEVRLTRLFRQLQADFNGDVFGVQGTSPEPITAAHAAVIGRFLRGDDLERGQGSLGFWVYDFSVVPIEMISGIYESFLTAEDSGQKRALGAYYTPRFLAEVVLDVALGDRDILESRFLDPACGSGIFLVALFHRLAHAWRQRHPNASRTVQINALRRIVTTQLVGVDANETACRLASLSLNLAFLDQLSPLDIGEVKKQKLPRLLTSGPLASGAGGIVHQDFFATALEGNAFDVVLGNPPWARAQAGSPLVQWIATRSPAPDVPQNQLAQGFVVKAVDHLAPGGSVCFLLPTGFLFNHQERAICSQRDWIRRMEVDLVVNLADLRRFLFESSENPALIVRYRPRIHSSKATVSYSVPKARPEVRRAEVLVLEREDTREISVSELLYELDRKRPGLRWKQAMWGTPRDWKLLDRLADFPSIEDVGRARGWVWAQGFQPPLAKERDRRGVPRPWGDDHLFLEPAGVRDLVVSKADAAAIGDQFPILRYAVSEDGIFQPPHVLISKGLRVSYCDFATVFRHSIHAVHGPVEDADQLRFLTVVLGSSLARYYVFHSTMSWGVARKEVHLDELVRFPFPGVEALADPKAGRERFRACVDAVKTAERRARKRVVWSSDEQGELRQRLDSLVFDYYDLTDQERILVEDTVGLVMPGAFPSRGTKMVQLYRPSRPAERSRYLETLLAALSKLAQPGASKLWGGIQTANVAEVALVSVTRRSIAGPRETESNAEVERVLQRAAKMLAERRGTMELRRGFVLFEDEAIHVLKPLSLKSWTRTAALNDADEISGAVLSRKRVPK